MSVADPASCRHLQMPQATIERGDVADFVVPVDEIAALLQKLVDEQRSPSA